MSHIPELDWRTQNNIYTLLAQEDSRAIWALADMDKIVRSTINPTTNVTLGRALLGESNSSWKGEVNFELSEDRLSSRQIARVHDYFDITSE